MRAFQEQRGLRVDGICGPETWGALIESGFQLGDRLLYLSGDDAARRRRRRAPAPAERARLRRRPRGRHPRPRDRDRAAPVPTQRGHDRRRRVRTGDARPRSRGSAVSRRARSPSVRERETLRRAPRRLDGLRVFLVVEPGDGRARARGRRERWATLGAVVALDVSGDDPSVLDRARPTASAPARSSRSTEQRRARRALRLLREPDVPLRGRPLPRAAADRVAAVGARRRRRAGRAHLPLPPRDAHDRGRVRARRPRRGRRAGRCSPPGSRT